MAWMFEPDLRVEVLWNFELLSCTVLSSYLHMCIVSAPSGLSNYNYLYYGTDSFVGLFLYMHIFSSSFQWFPLSPVCLSALPYIVYVRTSRIIYK